MVVDEGENLDIEQFESDGETRSTSTMSESASGTSHPDVRVGTYTWSEFMHEHGYGDEVAALYADSGDESWDRVAFDPVEHLGVHPDEFEDVLTDTAGARAKGYRQRFLDYVDSETMPVVKDVWTWEHYKWAYYYEADGTRPRDDDGEILCHDKEAALGFDPDALETRLTAGGDAASTLANLVDERTVAVRDDIDEDEFFSTADGHTTVTNRYDLEKAVPMTKKTHFREVERYWVNKPYAFAVVFHSVRENEKKYYVIEPYRTEIERDLEVFLFGKLRTAITYAEAPGSARSSRSPTRERRLESAASTCC
jgi:archaeal flagellar protein FlaI